MKRLFIVDYKEKGVCKHQCIAAVQIAQMSDEDIVKFCHFHVGAENELDSVIEVFENMTAAELNEISQTPLVFALRCRPIYVNADELKRCAAILKEANNGIFRD